MADQLYGVVPNFSEGRRTEVIEAIVEALHVPGARVVFAEADPDHNRLDTTVLGSADAVSASAMAGAEVAVELIDMREHRGGHPRMGAADCETGRRPKRRRTAEGKGRTGLRDNPASPV